MMKVFISQPMAGLTDDEILKRREELIQKVKEWFPDETIEVIDSFTKSEDIVNGGRIVMLGHSIQLLAQADMVMFASGWTDSPGCIVEHTVCKQYKIKTIYERHMPVRLGDYQDLTRLMDKYRNNINDDTKYWR